MNTPKKGGDNFVISPLKWEFFKGTSEKSVATYTQIERPYFLKQEQIKNPDTKNKKYDIYVANELE